MEWPKALTIWRTAYSTDRMCSYLEAGITDLLRAIEASHSTRLPTPAAPATGKVSYYYSTDGTQQGPVGANDLKMTRKDGLVTDDTPVLREGENEWRRLRDYVALCR